MGHALSIGIIQEEDIPTHIHEDFDWPKLQATWSDAKAHGSSTAMTIAMAAQPGSTATREEKHDQYPKSEQPSSSSDQTTNTDKSEVHEEKPK
ncbi:MAG: hypothetical protein ACKPKO_47120, partial [Candidatus Fonsibacter sp.]